MYCSKCDSTGVFKRPLDEEKYEKEFDRLDAPGTLTMGECRDKALIYAGYEEIPCSNCSKGKALKAYLDFRDETKGTIERLQGLKNTFDKLENPEKANEVTEMIEGMKVVLDRTNSQLETDFNWRK